jgi:hypothetical protein
MLGSGFFPRGDLIRMPGVARSLIERLARGAPKAWRA